MPPKTAWRKLEQGVVVGPPTVNATPAAHTHEWPIEPESRVSAGALEVFIEKLIAEGEYVDMLEVYKHLQIPNLRNLDLARTAQSNDRFIREAIKFYMHCTEIRSFGEVHDYITATLGKFLQKPISSFEDIGMGWLSGHKAVRALFGLDEHARMREKEAWPMVSDSLVIGLAIKYVRSYRSKQEEDQGAGGKQTSWADQVVAMSSKKNGSAFFKMKDVLLKDPELDARMNAFIREGLRLELDLPHASHVGISVDAKGLIHRIFSHLFGTLARQTVHLNEKIEQEFSDQMASEFRQQLVQRVRGFVVGAREGGLLAATERCLADVVDLSADYGTVRSLLVAAPDFSTFAALVLGELDLVVVPSAANLLCRAEAGDCEVCECSRTDASQLVAFFCRPENMHVRGSLRKNKMKSVKTFHGRLQSMLLALVVMLSLHRAEQSGEEGTTSATAPLSKSKPRSQRKAAQVVEEEEEARQAVEAKIRSSLVNFAVGVPEFCINALCTLLSDPIVVGAAAFKLSDVDAAQERECTLDLHLLKEQVKLHLVYSSEFSNVKETRESETRHTVVPSKILALVAAAFMYHRMVQMEQKSVGAEAAEVVLQQVPSLATEAVSEALRGFGSDTLGAAEVSEVIFGSLRRLESRLLSELQVPAMECLHRGSTLQYLQHHHASTLQLILEAALARMPLAQVMQDVAEGEEEHGAGEREVDLETLLGTISRALDDASLEIQASNSTEDVAAVVFRSLYRVEAAAKCELAVAHFEQAAPDGLSFLAFMERFVGYRDEDVASEKRRELRGAGSEFMRSLQLALIAPDMARGPSTEESLAVEEEAEAWMATRGHLAETAVLQTMKELEVQGGGREEKTTVLSAMLAQRFSLSTRLARRLTDSLVTVLLERDVLVIKAGSLVISNPKATAPLILLDPTLALPLPHSLAQEAKEPQRIADEERAIRMLASLPLGHSAVQATLWGHLQAKLGGATLLRFVAEHEKKMRVLRPNCVFFASAGGTDAVLLPSSFSLQRCRILRFLVHHLLLRDFAPHSHEQELLLLVDVLLCDRARSDNLAGCV